MAMVRQIGLPHPPDTKRGTFRALLGPARAEKKGRLAGHLCALFMKDGRHPIKTTKADAASQRDTGVGRDSACSREPSGARVIDRQPNPINKHQTNKSSSDCGQLEIFCSLQEHKRRRGALSSALGLFFPVWARALTSFFFPFRQH